MITVSHTMRAELRSVLRAGAAVGMVMVASFTVRAQSTGSTTGTTAANFTNNGASGATFTKIWVGARAAGMGGGYSALSDDISSLYWNPAGIARMPGVNVGVTYAHWFGDITHNFIGATIPISDRFRAGVSMTVVDYGSSPRTTLQKDADGGFYNANDMALGVTIAGALTDRFSFGGTIKYLRNAILDVSADGFAFDAGSLYQTDFYHTKISLDLSNLGPDRSFQGNSLSLLAAPSTSVNNGATPIATQLKTTDFPIPLTFRIGMATDAFQGKQENQKLNVALDFSTHSDGPEAFNLGGEYIYNDMFALRAGYAFNQDELGLGAGAGFHYKTEDFSGSLDYALNTTKNFGLIHRISVSALFQ